MDICATATLHSADSSNSVVRELMLASFVGELGVAVNQLSTCSQCTESACRKQREWIINYLIYTYRYPIPPEVGNAGGSMRYAMIMMLCSLPPDRDHHSKGGLLPTRIGQE